MTISKLNYATSEGRTLVDDIPTVIEATFHSDDPLFDIIDNTRIYMMLFEVQEEKRAGKGILVLHSLALRRNTEGCPFTRIGYFKISEYLEKAHEDVLNSEGDNI